MTATTVSSTAATRPPHGRLVRFLLAVDERDPGYVGGARTTRHDDGRIERELTPGPTLPVAVIIAARVGLLLAAVALTTSALIVTAWAIATEIGA